MHSICKSMKFETLVPERFLILSAHFLDGNAPEEMIEWCWSKMQQEDTAVANCVGPDEVETLLGPCKWHQTIEDPDAAFHL